MWLSIYKNSEIVMDSRLLKLHQQGCSGLVGARPLSPVVRRISPGWHSRSLVLVQSYPEPETEKERSPIDIPQEWITPEPSRRPDIFPEFERLETPLPKPLPGDPELPDEEEEEEEEKKKKNPGEDPDEEDEENPDQPAPSED